ncbi:MAG: hypothetical protein Q4A70_03365 [Candidatus Saccharibacteria bacterium]|nr:hypothetical protein [Candidatus Saccharibacteria bacterium]
MYFEDIADIEKIASKSGTTIFVVPDKMAIEIKNAIVLTPEDKTVITIEQVRNTIQRVSTKQTGECFVLIRPAEMLGEAAANAFLKKLEEPGEKVHFILVTAKPSMLLPTILSRAKIYFLKTGFRVDGGIEASDKTKDLAKRLMVAKPAELVGLAEEIARKKDGVRSYALEVIGVSIEMLYKSYFITGKPIFLQKLPKFLAVYEALARNGHIKLQIVANLI